MEYRDIMVPLDGSALAEHALPIAATLAKRADACVRVVAVVPGAGFLDPDDLPEAVAEGMRRSRDRLGRYVDGVVDELRRVTRVRVTGQVRIDAPIEGLLAAIDDGRMDLVVMTSHGRGIMKRAWLGSVADELVRRSPVPVVVLKPDPTVDADLRAHETFDSVLVPLDGSTVAEAALEPAIAFAKLHEAAITLLQVITTPYEIEPQPYGMNVDHVELVERRSRAEAYLHEVADRVRARGVSATPVVVEEEGVADAIVDYARNGAGAVIALATHGLGGVRRLLLGSVADKVLRGADCPVLVVRPAESEVRPQTRIEAAIEAPAQ